MQYLDNILFYDCSNVLLFIIVRHDTVDNYSILFDYR